MGVPTQILLALEDFGGFQGFAVRTCPWQLARLWQGPAPDGRCSYTSVMDMAAINTVLCNL
jgi:hypothetical protein